MAKQCVVCKKELGILTGKLKISDGYICSKCWEKAGFGTTLSDITNAIQYSSNTLNNMIQSKNENETAIKNFVATKKVGNIMQFSDDNQTFVVTTLKGFKKNQELFTYNQILDFELLEDGDSITKGGLGSAVAGGVLFGGVGAIVGGVTGGKKTKALCNSLKIKITFRDCYRQNIYIDLITAQTKTSSIIYKSAYKTAQDALSALQIACDKTSRNSTIEEKPISEADEILKFKKLLDDGIISQEEFETKKKQLLGM